MTKGTHTDTDTHTQRHRHTDTDTETQTHTHTHTHTSIFCPLQLQQMSVRAFDTLVYQALLHHLQTISKSLPAPARLVRVENIVHPSLLQRFAAHVETLVTTGALHDRSDAREDECPAEVRTLLPRLAFHGTCDRNVAASIAEQGLVSPGEHDHSGRLIGMARGALYGPGSYVSPSLLKSHWYAYGDARGHHQMVVGLALPGRCRMYTAESLRKVTRRGFEVHDLEWCVRC